MMTSADGSVWCKHEQVRGQCKMCKKEGVGGKGICEHGRRRTRCKFCGGASICIHGRVRYSCKEVGCGPNKLILNATEVPSTSQAVPAWPTMSAATNGAGSAHTFTAWDAAATAPVELLPVVPLVPLPAAPVALVPASDAVALYPVATACLEPLHMPAAQPCDLLNGYNPPPAEAVAVVPTLPDAMSRVANASVMGLFAPMPAVLFADPG